MSKSIIELWQEIDYYLSKHAPDILSSLNPGANAEDIHQVEIELGSELPEKLKDFYSIHNGQDPDQYQFLFEGWHFLSLQYMMQELRIWIDLVDDFEPHSGEPIGPVKDDWYNPKWLPFLSNGAGDFYCFDLDPAEGGQVGQIVEMWHDWGQRKVIAPQIDDYLSQFIVDLQSGVYKMTDEGLERQ